MFRAKWVPGVQTDEFETVKNIRRQVFADELGYLPTAIEDERDAISAAVLVYDDDGLPVATGRLHPSELGWKFGRIAVIKPARGKRYGDLVVRMLALRATETSPSSYFAVEAALSAVDFYKNYGFAEYGIAHEADGVSVQLMRVHCQDFVWNKYCTHCTPPQRIPPQRIPPTAEFQEK